jgi:hypothetical protein
MYSEGDNTATKDKASNRYQSLTSSLMGYWVSPFGNRGIKACSRLPHAYRSVPRPSSPVHAKASTKCPYLALETLSPPTAILATGKPGVSLNHVQQEALSPYSQFMAG